MIFLHTIYHLNVFRLLAFILSVSVSLFHPPLTAYTPHLWPPEVLHPIRDIVNYSTAQHPILQSGPIHG